jgi:SAM-dependent methyltransferase
VPAPCPKGTIPSSVTQPLEHSLAYRLCSGVLHETYETICQGLATLPLPRAPQPRLLDVGCWDGTATVRFADTLGAAMAGIEIFPEPAERARARGIDVAAVDLEREGFPWADATFDVVIANQIFEHLKNIYLPLSEVYRVLRPGGYFVISVPNLASAHNRVLLALGRQPTSIRTPGVHVRGYTLHELLGLVRLGGVFGVEAVRGVGFYPLTARLARPIARLWTNGSHTVVVTARKLRQVALSPWDAYCQEGIEAGVQTFYG